MKTYTVLSLVGSMSLSACAYHAVLREPVALNPGERASLAIRAWISSVEADPQNECFGMPGGDAPSEAKPPTPEPGEAEKLARQAQVEAWIAETKARDPARWERYQRAYPGDVAETTVNRISISPLGLTHFEQTSKDSFSFSEMFGGCCVFKGVHGTATAREDGSVEISADVDKDRNARSKCPQ